MLTTLLFFAASSITTVPLGIAVVRDGEGREFVAEIVDQIHDGKSIRSLNIECRAGCKNSPSVHDVFDDEPLGIFRLSDQNDILYITSSAGSSYKIRAYNLKETNINKVLDVASLSAPAIFTGNNSEEVIIYIHASERSSLIVKKHLYWRGGSFSANHGDGVP